VGNGEEVALFPAPPTPTLALPLLSELAPELRGRLELELLGLSVCAHPTELFPCAGEQRARGHRLALLIPCAELALHREERVSLRGWLAASRRVRTADGRWMRFLTLEDPSGLAEVVLFPPIYARDGHRLAERGPFLVSGRVEDPLGACTLHAERIW
jgi:DNA polymerase III alpha subunit